ncbi:MAG: hypothetical protein ACI943_003020, partial [Gammaproteobacteria bacterium]
MKGHNIIMDGNKNSVAYYYLHYSYSRINIADNPRT